MRIGKNINFLSSLSFRLKLQIAGVLLCLGLLSLTVIAVERASQNSAREKIEQDFLRTFTLLDQLLKFKLDSFQEAITSFLADPLFRSQVSRTRQTDFDLGLSNQPTNKLFQEVHQTFLSVDLPLFHRYPVFVILNDAGTVLFSRANPAQYGQNLSKLPLVKNTLLQGRALELLNFEDNSIQNSGILPQSNQKNELYLTFGQVIQSGGNSIGLVLAAENVLESFIQPLEESSFSKVVIQSQNGYFAARNGILSSDFLPWQKQLDSKKELKQAVSVPLKIKNETHLGLSAPFSVFEKKESIGKIYLIRSLHAEMKPFRDRLHQTLGVIFVISIIISMIAMSWLARKMTTPLLALEQGMRKLQAGDLSIEVRQTSFDEVGFLTRAFNKMTQGLREKTEVEALNAKLRGELVAAREIQRSLLPPAIQDFEGASLESLYHPCDELSGDFYDSILSDGWLYFYLADVTSHGTAAAQVTYLLKEIFRTSLQKQGSPGLSEWLQEARERYSAYQLNYDIGIQVARLHLTNKNFETIRANAPSPLWISENKPQVLFSQPLMGLLGHRTDNPKESLVQPLQLKLRAGEEIYFFTDGAYEFESGHTGFGTKRLYRLLQTVRSFQKEEWQKFTLNALAEANRSFVFEDDLTILRLVKLK